MGFRSSTLGRGGHGSRAPAGWGHRGSPQTPSPGLRGPLSLPQPSPAQPAPCASQARRSLARTHHAFLAQEAEEALVLLRGEQQGAHVGDPPRRRGLLLVVAHRGRPAGWLGSLVASPLGRPPAPRGDSARRPLRVRRSCPAHCGGSGGGSGGMGAERGWLTRPLPVGPCAGEPRQRARLALSFAAATAAAAAAAALPTSSKLPTSPWLRPRNPTWQGGREGWARPKAAEGRTALAAPQPARRAQGSAQPKGPSAPPPPPPSPSFSCPSSSPGGSGEKLSLAVAESRLAWANGRVGLAAAFAS